MILIILIEVLYSKIILKENPVMLLGHAFLIVVTGSMEPEIEAGELLIIQEAKNYKKGDIITFEDKDSFLVTHRIVEEEGKKVITKGDNNDFKDESITNSDIKGKVVFHSKILGKFVLYLLKPIVIIYAITLIIVMIFENFFIRERKGETDEKNENKT